MKTDELREKYLEFFESKGCIRRPSDVLVPHGDKSVLFTPAGMNQFKNQFLGIGPLDFTKATTCQKCIRTGDIGNVGVTAYHHTFFEMLGNFSFGDYFKREAIHWAWEFLTDKKWLGLAKDRLTVTVYLDDDEAYGIWEKEIGLATKQIQRCDESENFWPASSPSQGPDGVCGPCSEIYFHPPSGKEVEIWNLVFTQFNRVGNPPNNLHPLPKKNIDTGMGLERCAAVMQGVESNFEIDTLRPLCEAAGAAVGVKYSFDGEQGRPLRRIADHIRAVTMCVHEGVVPSNEKQGYIVRLLLRRALLEGYLLGKQDAFLHSLVPAVVDAMKRPYPDLVESLGAAADTIKEEEEQFLGIVERGLGRFQKIVDRSKKGDSIVTGEDAFLLHTQEGFLIEMTEAMAARHGMKVDSETFQKLLDQHRETSGRGSFSDSVMAEGPLDAIRKGGGVTEFLGYDSTRGTGKVIGIIANKELVSSQSASAGGEPIAVVLDRTPFYGETGGQVGDTGTLTLASGGTAVFDVIDTQRDGDLVLHVGNLKSGVLKVGDAVEADVVADRRDGIRRAHSATHILHHALRMTLGPNAQQRGSLVDNDVLRFDFSNKGPMSQEEILRVEDEINARIAEGASVATQVTDQQTAKQRGAMMLFGEKYPDKVRMVTMGDFSVELCGGIHLSNTGQVGLCRIVSEEGVAKGVRRIVAYTGRKALQQVREADDLLKQVAISLKAPQLQELPRRVDQLVAELAQAKKEIAKFTQAAVADSVGEYLSKAETVGESKIIAIRLDGIDRDTLRSYADRLRQEGKSAAVLLATEIDGKVSLLAAVTPDLVKKGVKAGDAVREAAKLVGGGGGGRPDLAEAGGKDPAQIDAALKVGAAVYRNAMGG